MTKATWMRALHSIGSDYGTTVGGQRTDLYWLARNAKHCPELFPVQEEDIIIPFIRGETEVHEAN